MRNRKLLALLGCSLLTGCGFSTNSPTSNTHYITPTQAPNDYAEATLTPSPTVNVEPSDTLMPTDYIEPTGVPEITDYIEPTSAPLITDLVEPTEVPLEVITPTNTPTEVPTATPTNTPELTSTLDPTNTQAITPDTTEICSINSEWEFAEFSKINTGSSVLYRSNSATPKHKIICVNAGHGTSGGTNYSVQCHPDGSPKIISGSTSAGQTTASAIAYGTVMQDGTAEAIATKNLALVLKEVLLSNGYDVLMLRETDDVALDNIARTVMANNLSDCHIALHYDSTDFDKGAFYMSVPNVESYKSMYPVSNVWMENNRLGESIISGFRAHEIKIFSSGSMEMDLVQMSYSTIPNIDLEVGDIASSRSEDTLRTLSEGILEGLNIYYGF